MRPQVATQLFGASLLWGRARWTFPTWNPCWPIPSTDDCVPAPVAVQFGSHAALAVAFAPLIMRSISASASLVAQLLDARSLRARL